MKYAPPCPYPYFLFDKLNPLIFSKSIENQMKKMIGGRMGDFRYSGKKTKYCSSNGCLYTFNDSIDFSPNSTNKIKHIKDKTYSQKCGGGFFLRKYRPLEKSTKYFSPISFSL